MALVPALAPLAIAGNPDSPHTLDIFLDYVCPFSAKIAFTIDKVVKPLLSNGGKYDGKVKIIIRPQVQPWHVASTLTHESALAVIRVSPESFWPYSIELFKNQSHFFDLQIANLTVTQIREKLIDLALSIYTIKFARQNGIHVSPTVLWDGLVVNEISSSWGAQEWSDFLKAKVSV
ncbi:hypothetical protein PNOK_0365700 [Pyrrhoderma noxium]|uniref:Thioredoxin-like fold domain-containing protein n=1 Tax=Pyrrhoderma noxium TaxID=2282107 RepID=A0A286UN89_9AGAM|nr:hypothetical protein PNOK_0365700 [Pyrrhoderma noxium]